MEKKANSQIKYGVALEKVSTQLRRLALIGALPHKQEVASLLKATIDLRGQIEGDAEIEDPLKNDLTTRVDTFAWFMHSMLEETQTAERLSSNVQKEEFHPDYLE